jgi:hypothetical protein
VLFLLLLSTRARILEILRLDRGDWKPERMWVLGNGDCECVVSVTEKRGCGRSDSVCTREVPVNRAK